ncbi:formate C-acetyltransferase [Sporobacter termitidis DSM 10068]|uniref:Formate C-acetyltransferase n=1 Tax=Sporobacter termitidis DSM 10068 TaxID=1123282 RepID=A0A1M5Z3H5_9FIRM|nr:pyruvate formate lyase family protein [Sporobacter termitidis]SHI18749.1 formate C-acetyltransferase [Sporobacter termitidis DSM 10068]
MENFDISISERILGLKAKRERINRDLHLNIERNRIITEYYKAHENEYPVLKRAGYLYAWCATREINIEDDDIFLGDAGPHCRTVHFDIEQTSQSWLRGCFGDTDERFRAAWQVPGSIWVDDEDRQWLLEAADYWEGKDIGATARGLFPPEFTENAGPVLKDLTGSYPGHFNPNYERAVTVGFGAVRQTAIEKLDEIRKHTTADNVRSELFYRGLIKVCDGMILMSKRYAEGCRKKAETATPDRRAELLKMADSCDWIVENPARNLWEGFQTIFFYQYLITADGTHWADSPGLIDSFLGPLLENDVNTGALTREQAQELCDAFLLHYGDQIIMFPKPDNDRLIEAHRNGKTMFDLQGGMQNIAAGSLITLGGQKTDGTGDYNLATEMLLLSYYRLRVAEPSLALRINKHTPDRIWEIGIACSKRSGGLPQFNNDDVIIQTMLDKGVPLEDARRYAVFGCVEPAISGKEWSMAANCGGFGGGSSLINILQYVIHGNVNPMMGTPGMLPCKKLYEYESFEELKAEFERQVRFYIDYGARLYHFAALVFDQAWPCLSASVMTEGCLESGKDVTWGGAKYNGMGSMLSAVATVGDSLMTIKKLCFDDKTVSARELYDALQANWEGHELLRQRILNEVPFYGNDNDEPDALVQWFTNLWADHFNSRPGVNHGTNNCGALDLYWVWGGKMTWATPDGRKTGDPLSPSSDPRQDAVKNGPLAYVKSVAKMPWDKMRCGGAINLRFDANSVRGEDATAKVRELIQSYFAMGGIQFHFTVADTAIMRAAQKNPQDYQDLIVRIAGFSAYFTHLPFDDQENYIARYEIGV